MGGCDCTAEAGGQDLVQWGRSVDGDVTKIGIQALQADEALTSAHTEVSMQGTDSAQPRFKQRLGNFE